MKKGETLFMREIHKDMRRWMDEGLAVAIAQVTKTWGSSPRQPGSAMAITSDGRIAGSVSGGCVEGNVIQTALKCLENGEGYLEKFHATNAQAIEVGLSCGGSVEILIGKLLPEIFDIECTELLAKREYVRVTIAKSPNHGEVGTSFLILSHNSIFNHEKYQVISVPSHRPEICYSVISQKSHVSIKTSDVIYQSSIDICKLNRNETAGYMEYGDYQVFYHRVVPSPKLICVGGVHISVYLTQIAKLLGYKTMIIDPREIFATEERFPFVDELTHSWPQEVLNNSVLDSSTALCALTHDPKIDVPALMAALESPAFYIGSLGSCKTQFSRYMQLVEEGYSDDKIKRIHGPIGLDLRGREPAEIALSIMAEITMARSGGSLPTRLMLDSCR